MSMRIWYNERLRTSFNVSSPTCSIPWKSGTEFETTSNHYSRASNTKCLQKKMFIKKKHLYHPYYHHHHHHRHHHCFHYHQFHHNHHSLLALPGANPVWGPLGWRKQMINIVVLIIIIKIIIIIIKIITIVIVFHPLSGADCA